MRPASSMRSSTERSVAAIALRIGSVTSDAGVYGGGSFGFGGGASAGFADPEPEPLAATAGGGASRGCGSLRFVHAVNRTNASATYFVMIASEPSRANRYS